jgi:hypothetical protein
MAPGLAPKKKYITALCPLSSPPETISCGDLAGAEAMSVGGDPVELLLAHPLLQRRLQAVVDEVLVVEYRIPGRVAGRCCTGMSFCRIPGRV